MNIVIAGGSGFIGRHLIETLWHRGHEVVVLTRGSRAAVERLPSGVRPISWEGGWVPEVQRADAVVNLAGASIGGGRWTAARKRALVESRVGSTEAIVQAMAQPTALISASGIDYYGDHPGNATLDEYAPAGASFLAQLCVRWENAAQQAERSGVRVVQIRTAFCVGRGAPALRLLALPFRLFAGGPLGSGQQWFTWIHIEDLVNLYVLAIENSDFRGPLNAVAPHVPRERDVARAIGRALRRPCWAPTPEFALRLALGEMADLLLHGRRAVPARAQAAGYQFRYPDIGAALQEALR